jgi:ATP-dependent Clp protease ATP-binding subunit ClpC
MARRKNLRAQNSPQEHIEALIGELRELRFEEDDERFEDIVSELVHASDPDRLLALCASIHFQERRAGALALGRLASTPERALAILDRLGDANWKVQLAAAQATLLNPFPGASGPLGVLAMSPHRDLRLVAIEALGKIGDPDAAPTLIEVLDDADWRLRQEAVVALGRLRLPDALSALLRAMRDSDEDVRNAAADALQPLLPPPADALQRELLALDDKARRALLENLQKQHNPERLALLTEPLQALLAAHIDPDELARFGRLITSPDELPHLDHAYERDAELEALLKALARPGNASTLLMGEPGVGKTALIHALARHAAQHWPDAAILETSTSEIMVGTRYIGEWETRLHSLIEKIKKPRRVILYLTNVNDLPGAGTTSTNQQNFITLLGPHVRRGEVVIVGESNGEALRRGLEADPSIRRLFQTIPLEEPSREATRRIVARRLAALGEAAGVALEAAPEVLDLVMDLAGNYYGAQAQPGRSLTALQQAAERALERAGAPRPDRLTLQPEDVIDGIARFTGLPRALLNDRAPLDLEEARAALTARVLGQPEAVGAMVDLIALIKAGLNDPARPLGVFLFVGPTGVGKTELARALAAYVFGDPDRLLRFDLSEYPDYDAHEKLLGSTLRYPGDGRLTGKVREQPFRVILLDEIEKAHANVFDLLLQVFDAGRLTDGKGRVADFRHTILIMTSNLASAFSPGGPLGFGDDEAAALASPAGVLREVQRFFRPEFINRIDKIAVFKPLAEADMAQIARREIERALQRSGLTRRRLAVDLDPTLVEHLMARGFSRAYGARPLKRAIEAEVLLPLARQIVAAGADHPDGARLRLRVHRDQDGARVIAEPSPTP